MNTFFVLNTAMSLTLAARITDWSEHVFYQLELKSLSTSGLGYNASMIPGVVKSVQILKVVVYSSL